MTHAVIGGAKAPRGSVLARARPILACIMISGLAACASVGPQIPATQEAAEYRSHAQSYYHPPGPAWDPWGPYVKEASARFDVPEVWIRSVMKQESAGQEFAVSTPGAMGLMQVMPFTYDLMREQYNLDQDPYDPRNNILAGTAYIRQMYDIYGSPGFLAAYNAGPGRLDDFLTRNRPLPAETRHYVAAIGPEIAFDSPHSRSQADLMAMNHASGDYQVASAGGFGRSPSDPALRHDVSTAWARREGGTDEATEEVASADLPPSPAHTMPASARPAGSVATAWASRMANPGSVAAAWASREAATSTQGTPPTRVAGAFLPGRSLGAAPLPSDATAPPAAPSTASIRLAAAQADATPPSQELADSVADAPDQSEPALPDPYAAPHATARHTRFRLVNQAVAEPVSFRTGRGVNVAGTWSIQVGAYGSPGAAHQAAGQARAEAHALLGNARTEVASLHDRRGRMYRARLTGLSHDAAIRACHHLGDCMVVSPEGT